MAHQRLPNKKRIEPCRAQQLQMLRRMDAALRHVHRTRRQTLDKTQRSFQAYLKRAQVAIVHAICIAAQIE